MIFKNEDGVYICNDGFPGEMIASRACPRTQGPTGKIFVHAPLCPGPTQNRSRVFAGPGRRYSNWGTTKKESGLAILLCWLYLFWKQIIKHR